MEARPAEVALPTRLRLARNKLSKLTKKNKKQTIFQSWQNNIESMCYPLLSNFYSQNLLRRRVLSIKRLFTRVELSYIHLWDL